MAVALDYRQWAGEEAFKVCSNYIELNITYIMFYPT